MTSSEQSTTFAVGDTVKPNWVAVVRAVDCDDLLISIVGHTNFRCEWWNRRYLERCPENDPVAVWDAWWASRSPAARESAVRAVEERESCAGSVSPNANRLDELKRVHANNADADGEYARGYLAGLERGILEIEERHTNSEGTTPLAQYAGAMPDGWDLVQKDSGTAWCVEGPWFNTRQEARTAFFAMFPPPPRVEMTIHRSNEAWAPAVGDAVRISPDCPAPWAGLPAVVVGRPSDGTNDVYLEANGYVAWVRCGLVWIQPERRTDSAKAPEGFNLLVSWDQFDAVVRDRDRLLRKLEARAEHASPPNVVDAARSLIEYIDAHKVEADLSPTHWRKVAELRGALAHPKPCPDKAARSKAWKGAAEDGSIGFDLQHDGRSLGAVTFAADGDVEIVLTKTEPKELETPEDWADGVDAAASFVRAEINQPKPLTLVEIVDRLEELAEHYLGRAHQRTETARPAFGSRVRYRGAEAVVIHIEEDDAGFRSLTLAFEDGEVNGSVAEEAVATQTGITPRGGA